MPSLAAFLEVEHHLSYTTVQESQVSRKATTCQQVCFPTEDDVPHVDLIRVCDLSGKVVADLWHDHC